MPRGEVILIKRTRRKPEPETISNENTNDYSYSTEQEPLMIFKATYDKIKAVEKSPADCMWLYLFYYQKAKWHKIKTTRVYATTGYAASGLNWSESRVRKTKKILMELGLVEDFKLRTRDDFRIDKHLIKINFIAFDKTRPDDLPQDRKTHPMAVATPIESHSMDLCGGRTLSTKKEKALKDITTQSESLRKETPPKESKSLPEEYINWCTDILRSQKKRHPTIIKRISRQQIIECADTVDKLIRLDRYDFELIKSAIEWGIRDVVESRSNNSWMGWSAQLISLAPLRKSKNGSPTKFQKVLTAYEGQKGTCNSKEVSARILSLAAIFMNNKIGISHLTENGQPKTTLDGTKLQAMLSYHDRIRWPVGYGSGPARERMQRDIGTPDKLMQEYCAWINLDQIWITHPETFHFGVTDTFHKFMAQIKDDYDGEDILPKEW